MAAPKGTRFSAIRAGSGKFTETFQFQNGIGVVGAMTVTGAAEFSSTVKVAGALGVVGALTATTGEFSSTVQIGGVVTLKSDFKLANGLTFSNTALGSSAGLSLTGVIPATISGTVVNLAYYR